MRKLWYRVKQFFINIKEVTRLNEKVEELQGKVKDLQEKVDFDKTIISRQEIKIDSLEAKYVEMEKFMETAKGIVKETQSRAEIVKKQKWLTGYPDETGKKV